MYLRRRSHRWLRNVQFDRTSCDSSMWGTFHGANADRRGFTAKSSQARRLLKRRPERLQAYPAAGWRHRWDRRRGAKAHQSNRAFSAGSQTSPAHLRVGRQLPELSVWACKSTSPHTSSWIRSRAGVENLGAVSIIVCCAALFGSPAPPRHHHHPGPLSLSTRAPGRHAKNSLACVRACSATSSGAPQCICIAFAY